MPRPCVLVVFKHIEKAAGTTLVNFGQAHRLVVGECPGAGTRTVPDSPQLLAQTMGTRRADMF